MMTLIGLTNPAGQKLILVVENISEVLPARGLSYPEVTNSVVVMTNGNKHAVAEAVDDVVRAIADR